MTGLDAVKLIGGTMLGILFLFTNMTYSNWNKAYEKGLVDGFAEYRIEKKIEDRGNMQCKNFGTW